MKRQPENLRPRFKLWLSTNRAEGVFGDGKWRLLKAIDREGSLRAAAESLGMSYRKAWGDLNKAENHLGIVLIEKRRGGIAGGQTCLTETGRRWMSGYARFRSSLERALSKACARHIAPLKK